MGFIELSSRGLFTNGFLVLLDVDRLKYLEYQYYLGAMCNIEHIAVKVDGTQLGYLASENTSPTAFGITRHLSLTMSFTLSRTQPRSHRKKLIYLVLISFHVLGATYNLTVSVLIDRNCYPHSWIFKFSLPVAVQIEPIHFIVS